MPLTFLKVLHVFLKELGESDKLVWVCAHTQPKPKYKRKPSFWEGEYINANKSDR